MNTKDLRDGKKRKKAPCYVCGKHRQISHWHHTTPLKDIKGELEYWAGETVDLVSLCPNCHAIIHKLEAILKIKDEEKRYIAVAELFDGYSEREFGKFMEVVGMKRD